MLPSNGLRDVVEVFVAFAALVALEPPVTAVTTGSPSATGPLTSSVVMPSETPATTSRLASLAPS